MTAGAGHPAVTPPDWRADWAAWHARDDAFGMLGAVLDPRLYGTSLEGHLVRHLAGGLLSLAGDVVAADRELVQLAVELLTAGRPGRPAKWQSFRQTFPALCCPPAEQMQAVGPAVDPVGRWRPMNLATTLLYLWVSRGQNGLTGILYWVARHRPETTHTTNPAGDGWRCEVAAALIRDVFPVTHPPLTTRNRPRPQKRALARPVLIPLEWRTADVLGVAEQVWESRDAGLYPILADALQDAGCDRADVLEHLRGSDPHCRGCWVLFDLLLSSPERPPA